jgi:hypothetical protein
MRLTFFVSILIAVPAFAADGSPDNWCREGLLPSYGNFQTGKLLGEKGAKIHFRRDNDDCPNDTHACQRKKYLIPGDEVVVAHRYQAFVCAWFNPKKGPPTVGWLPAVSVEVQKSATPTGLNAWEGSWRYFDNVLDIAPKKGALAVKGMARWNGGGGNLHFGEVEASAAPQGNVLRVVDGQGCEVTLTFVGTLLVAHDNGKCGGMNVRFDGVYQKR